MELVLPHARWISDYLESANHPQSLADAGGLMTRPQVSHFIDAYPLGHQPSDPIEGLPPTYHFWMHLIDKPEIPIPMAGSIALRIGQGTQVEQYYGHIGYGVFPPARGHHYAERACRLLFPLARRHGLNSLWITCNPDNIPSRRTCQRLGAELVEIIPVPSNHRLYMRGDHEKCRFLLKI